MRVNIPTLNPRGDPKPAWLAKRALEPSRSRKAKGPASSRAQTLNPLTLNSFLDPSVRH